MDCLFCKITKHQLPSQIVFENDRLIAFHDIKPAADLHLLIVPKVHIESVAHLTEKDRGILADLIYTAKDIAKEKDLHGYKLAFNVGRKGGQLIDHIHLHLLANVS